MSKSTSVPAVLADSYDAMKATPGAIRYFRAGDLAEAGLSFSCPCGCGAVGAVNLKPSPGRERPMWHNSGTREAPTLHPSVGFSGYHDSPKGPDGYHWHGWLRAGVWERC